MAGAGQRRLPDRVDPAVQRVQPAALKPVVDRPDAQPQRAQLCSRDGTGLLGRERRDSLIGMGWMTLTVSGEVNVSHPRSVAGGA